MQPRESAPFSVAEQNLELIASWLVTGCGQTSHACSVVGRVSRGEVVDVEGTTRGIVAAT
jgi:hypothetical protein